MLGHKVKVTSSIPKRPQKKHPVNTVILGFLLLNCRGSKDSVNSGKAGKRGCE